MEKSAQYIRAPYQGVDADFSSEIEEIPAPDEKSSLILSHGWEYRPGTTAFLFTLLDKKKEVIEDFSPHTTNGLITWSEDAKYLGILIGEVKIGFLIMNLIDHSFALIPFIKKPPANVTISQGKARFTMSSHFLSALNADTLIGGGKSEIPRAKYEKSADLTIQLSKLAFLEKSKLKDIFDHHQGKDSYQMGPIQNGFWPFDGKFPQNTIDGFNGRPFEVYQLKAFAAYGDAQSQRWMQEIETMTDGKYNRFLQVSYYLGERKRE